MGGKGGGGGGGGNCSSLFQSHNLDVLIHHN